MTLVNFTGFPDFFSSNEKIYQHKDGSLHSRLNEIKGLTIFIALIWIAYLFFSPQDLLQYGIQPRKLEGLTGVVLAPFLHTFFGHLLHNSILLAIFGSIHCVLIGQGLMRTMVLQLLIGGLLTWVIGSKGSHVGASGLVFALWSHLLFLGWIRKHWLYSFVSFAILLSYSSMIRGLLPFQPYISWEGHLSGCVSGYLTAKVYLKQQRNISLVSGK